MKFSQIAKGYAAINAGVWVDKIPLPFFDGIRLKVRRLWSPMQTALYEKQLEAGGDLSDAEKEKRAGDEALIGACLLDWDGVDDAYTIEAARALLADSELGTPFRTAIVWAATHVADRVKAQLGTDQGN